MTASKKKIIDYKKLQLLTEFSRISLNNLKLVECGKTKCFILIFFSTPWNYFVMATKVKLSIFVLSP